MRKKILFGALLCASVISTKAQWSLTGNAGINPVNNFLGTTDSKALVFRTNNIERMRIIAGGKFGFGTILPTTRFQINVLSNQSPFSTWVNGLPTLYADSTGGLSVGGGVSASANGLNVVGITAIGTSFPSAKLHVNADAAQTVFRAQSNGSTKLLVSATGGVSVGSPSIGPANGLFVNGSTGMGTTVPETKLHVVGGSDVSLATGGYITSGITSSLNIAIDDNEIMARNNGAISTLTLNASGGSVSTGADLIVGGLLDVTGATIGFGSVEQLTDAGAFTIGSNSNFVSIPDAVNSLGSSTNRWLDVWAADGTINTSDARDKKNIRDLNYGLNEIMQLHSVKFNWKAGANQNDKVGLIAQELQKVIPEVVRDYEFKTDETTGKREKVPSERLGVMYSDLIPVLIKAIQEQQLMIEELKSMVQNGSSSSASAVAAIPEGVRLEQNSPNPFTNVTTIRYSIPTSVSTAQMIITNSNGTVVKTVSSIAKGNGTVTINANELTAGTYYYSLLLDGKKADTKKMILVK